jgi:hypothetical protein
MCDDCGGILLPKESLSRRHGVMQVFGTPGDDWVIAVGVLLIMLLTMVVALIIAPGTP